MQLLACLGGRQKDKLPKKGLLLEAAGDALERPASLQQDPLDDARVVVAVAEVMVEGGEAVRLALLGRTSAGTGGPAEGTVTARRTAPRVVTHVRLPAGVASRG